MIHVELRYEHYIAIRDFMSEIELDPEDSMTPIEAESLAMVKQIIANIEARRAQPPKPHQHARRYRKAGVKA